MAATSPKVKICGVTTPADAEHAAAHGAWAIGMVFFPRSRRRCGVDAAVEIGAAVKRRCEVAGVFVNARLEWLTGVADRAQLTLVQLHGDEGPSYCGEVARRTGCRVIKAVRVHSRADLQALAAYRTDFHLLDGDAGAARGGGGEPFDWSLVAAHRGEVPMIVAGGLTPDNVRAAIEATRPYAVDVASGVEAEPGRKDPALVEGFIAAARADTADVGGRAA